MAALYKTSTGRMFHAGEIAIVTVGLPARGKTYLSHKLCRYLRWLGVPTEIFSVGDYRRRQVGAKQMEFFSSESTAAIRQSISDLTLNELIVWLKQSSHQVAIYDASNTEPAKRRAIYERLKSEGIQVLFLESICDRRDIIAANIREMKLTSPDYVDFDPEWAVEDFQKRIEICASTYESVQEPEYSYIKDINVGETIITNQIKGYLPTRIVYYLMNLHIMPRRIYLSRNGESLNDVVIRSDAPLSPTGLEYARILPAFLNDLRQKQGIVAPLKVWTSPRQRSTGTAVHFADLYTQSPVIVYARPSLVEMNPGAVDGMSDEEIRKTYPEEYETHQKKPYLHRYPRAESYHDLAIRLEDILLELEREKDDILIIAHPTVLRCIYAYLQDKSETEIPELDIPAHTVVELVPKAYGCKEQRYSVDNDWG